MKKLFKDKKYFKVTDSEINGFDSSEIIQENEILLISKNLEILKKYQGQNTEIDKNLNALKSTKKGYLTFINFKINILPLEIIDGDLDFLKAQKTFKGNLWVKGDIVSGIDLNINGSLQVDGIVENVKIKCNGDVYIKRGFLGQEEGIISCKGNFFSEYVQNGNVKANNVIIGEALVNSNLVAIGGLIVKGKGRIVGGNYFVKDYIIAKEIGSAQIIPTDLKLGYDFLKKRKFNILKKNLINLKIKINENNEIFKNYFSNINYPQFEIDLIMKNISRLNEDRQKYIKLLENIELKEKYHIFKASLDKFSLANIENVNAYLKTEVIHPGVDIFILNKTLSVREKIEQKNLIIKKEDIDKWQQF